MKATSKRLTKSPFFYKTLSVVSALDYYLTQGDEAKANLVRYQWEIANKALEVITGNSYEILRDGRTWSIVNVVDHNDILFSKGNRMRG